MNSIAYFNYVRDLPYEIPLLAKRAKPRNIEDELMRDPSPKKNKQDGLEDHTCLGKHKALGHFLAVEDIEARFRVCEFKWSAIKAIPKSILALPHDDAISHVYLEARINNKWIKVDATWDAGLSKVLPVNCWDGKSNTKIAVPGYYTYSPKESAMIMNQEEDLAADLKKNCKFYSAINEWLAKSRKG